MDAVAINVGANTNLPGFRGPIHSDGSFEYVPIPEREPTTEPVPTYGDLDTELDVAIPPEVHDMPVHLDPEFADYPFGQAYTYGDEHGVKAGPLSELSAGDMVFFYATLTTVEPATWLPPTWGAFVIGQFRLAENPLTAATPGGIDPIAAKRFPTNAHCKRDPVDARVLLRGDPATSGLYDRAVPLSEPSAGVDANWLVTEYSSDSGRGPWWRRPLRFDADGVDTLLDLRSRPQAAAVSRE